MREITTIEALREALREEMQRDPNVFLMGEDVGYYGGIFGVSKGLIDEFGPERVRDTPISEEAIVAFGMGAAVGLFYALPVLVLFGLGQRYLLNLYGGGVKG